jgi:hypothetical protein
VGWSIAEVEVGREGIRHRYDTGTTWELVINTSNDYVGGHSGFCVDFSVFDSGFLRRLKIDDDETKTQHISLPPPSA